MPSLSTFMSMAGEKYKVFRNGEQVSTVEGMQNTEDNTRRKYVGFYPDADIQVGDWITGEVSKNEFFIEDMKTDVVQGKAFQKKGYSLTRAQYEKQQIESGKISHQFNIQNAYGSSFGSSGTVTLNNTFNFEALDQEIEEKGKEDKEELRQMIAEIKELFEDSEKVKKGSLSKFSEVMQKHSWITGAVAKLGLDFMIGQK
ncbi:hypothetical protein [Paenibacillus sp. Root444D2]|uniref:hypothetical protein n=1 Tax=Paenibacillus sp. Root444D2 TaxID=1736538 RepID=UPI00070EF0CB|nr:hypothetical protein [Paenibacillus sp. Root444D2]KQX69257.1 hypothetical protein ASD40_01785 [Paenibacillus sp. Root444D2]